MGFALLNFKIRAQKSVAGISSRMLELFLLHLGTRLMSTCLKNGYIPMDSSPRAVTPKALQIARSVTSFYSGTLDSTTSLLPRTGDLMYQLCDIGSLLFVLDILCARGSLLTVWHADRTLG